MFGNKYIFDVCLSIILHAGRLMKSIFIFVPLALFWFIGFSVSFNPVEMLNMFSSIGNISKEQLSLLGFVYVLFHGIVDTLYPQANHLSGEVAFGVKPGKCLGSENGNP